jgi:hypothetical protein
MERTIRGRRPLELGKGSLFARAVVCLTHVVLTLKLLHPFLIHGASEG